MSWIFWGLAIWIGGLFTAFGLFVAACYGYDWWVHKEAKHDPETCDECRFT